MSIDHVVDHSKVQHVVDVALGFWKSKVLLTAIELGLFTELADASMTGIALGDRLGLHERGRADFLDALVALGFLERAGDGEHAEYRNTPESAELLDKASPSYMGGVLEMTNVRLYPFWAHLGEALKTGEPQNETRQSKVGWYETLYADPARLEQFMAAMAGYQLANFRVLVESFDFGEHRSFCDIGGASGALAIEVARRHPKVHCMTYDLPAVAPIAQRRIQSAGLGDRVDVVTGDFMTEALPAADVLAMGNVLHNWGTQAKLMLVGKAYDALPEGGAFLAIEHLIDDERRRNADAMLMSLDMLIETAEGYEATGVQFDSWCKNAGFRSTEIRPLVGATSVAIARKYPRPLRQSLRMEKKHMHTHETDAVALLIVDMQNDFVLASSPFRVAGAEETVPAARRLLDVARGRDWTVVHVVRAYRADGVDVETPRVEAFRRAGGYAVPGTAGAEIVEELAPREGEYTIVKPRFSGFMHTELDLILRRLRVARVVICGTQYPNCIRATAFDALELDYEVTVVTSATSAESPSVAEANIRDLRTVGIRCVELEEIVEDVAGGGPAAAFGAPRRVARNDDDPAAAVG